MGGPSGRVAPGGIIGPSSWIPLKLCKHFGVATEYLRFSYIQRSKKNHKEQEANKTDKVSIYGSGYVTDLNIWEK